MIHIACNIDTNFTQHCAVMLVSLFENNRSSSFFIHIVTLDLPDTDKKVLEDIVTQYQNKIQFYLPPTDSLSGFSIRRSRKHITIAAYYRCMLSAILPDDIDKVLYLDCDLVILDNISELWNTVLADNCAIGCVEDSGSNGRCENLRYDSKYSYFNSGVLLINLKYWRMYRVDEQCVRYFQTYPERIRYNDQDILNALLYNHKIFISLKWNMQDGFYRCGTNKRTAKEWPDRQDLLHPAILHYTSKKPWNYDSMHPLRSEYYKYLDMTPWKGKRPLSSFKALIQRCVKLLPYTLKLRQPKYIKL